MQGATIADRRAPVTDRRGTGDKWRSAEAAVAHKLYEIVFCGFALGLMDLDPNGFGPYGLKSSRLGTSR